MAGFVLQDAAADLAQDRVFRGFGKHPEQRDREGLGDQLQPDRLQIPGAGAEQGIEDLFDVAGERIALAVEPQRHVAVQDLVVPRLVDHLGRLEQFGVLADHILDHLAAHQHRAVLAMHQGREAPARDPPVELDALRRRQPLPEWAAVDVNEVVGDQPAIAVERPVPVDVGRRIPLVELGLLIKPPHVGMFAVIDMAEIGGVLGFDVMTALHGRPLSRRGRGRRVQFTPSQRRSPSRNRRARPAPSDRRTGSAASCATKNRPL